MSKPIILISKDILMPGYLPTYGNKYWKTPNIDALAANGTVFLKHYTAAPSTAMAFTSMFTSKYPYQLNRTKYTHEAEYSDSTLFDELESQGYSSHIIWSDNYMKVAHPFANCFGHANIHTLDMNQPVGPYIKGLDEICRNDEKADEIIEKLYVLAKDIITDNVFLWIHLPHVILGRCSYGDDIDLVDKLVGLLRTIADDDCFYITADHGNMNGSKGKWVYGFDVYESAIHIPLITPRIDGMPKIDFLTSNTQLSTLLRERSCTRNDYVISDSAYYAQPNRNIAIIKDRYKLIYRKLNNSFELYDIDFDPQENVNMLNRLAYDNERRRYTNVREAYYYPGWGDVEKYHSELMDIFNRMYRKTSAKEELVGKTKYIIMRIIGKQFNKHKLKKKVVRK
ncbi:MAG: Sulfatase [Firmicutes bacterium ADurb.Bin182]|nr:MAG: Sulfatase [Firmicutes bacterium ADurb.Bin182]